MTEEQLRTLRAKIHDKSVSDEVAEELSASLGLAQDIRTYNLYIDDAFRRLEAVFDWLLLQPPKLILARDERARLQMEVYRTAGRLTALLARISGGSPTALVIIALLTSCLLWAISVGLLLYVIPWVVPEDFGFMEAKVVLNIVTAAFIGGLMSIATRMRDFTRFRDLDPFAMFWTAVLKPLIGVVLSVFLLATLAGGVISFGFLDPNPFNLGTNNGASEKTLYALWMLGFLAGFSERFAWDFVNRAQGAASGGVGKDSSQ